MTAATWICGGLGGWLILGTLVAPRLGRMIRRADDAQPEWEPFDDEPHVPSCRFCASADEMSDDDWFHPVPVPLVIPDFYVASDWAERRAS